jgi:hypothetical protein
MIPRNRTALKPRECCSLWKTDCRPKDRSLIVTMGLDSFRSADGAWVIEFPNSMLEGEPREATVKNGGSGKAVGKLDLQIPDHEENGGWRGAFCGTSGRFIAATNDTVQAFEIPSGKKIADFPKTTWQDADATKTDPAVTVACSSNGKRVAIRSGARLTCHNVDYAKCLITLATTEAAKI